MLLGMLSAAGRMAPGKERRELIDLIRLSR
jgi:hypothetical protein